MFEYRTMVADALPNAKNLGELDADGWELIQVLPFTEGITDIEPGQIAVYLRRMKPST